MAQGEFKPSEIVEVLSGGPMMTVTQVGDDGMGTMTAWCVWFDGTKKMEGTFPVTALKHSENARPPRR